MALSPGLPLALERGSAVGKRIRDALKQITTVNPALGRYLRATVRTGTFCSYTPDPRLRVECEV